MDLGRHSLFKLFNSVKHPNLLVVFLSLQQNIGKQLLALPNCQSTCFPPQQTGRSLKLPAALLGILQDFKIA
uniref:Uncharacterized protein n=1 Tax=Meloidogyne enterolobii TaxID=390850 RepID=A0A6V7WLZ9_MELEN|nr:unnamed protein product [Meloidogyne enterolobii]